MTCMLVTLEVFQVEMSPLKAVLRNICSMLSTFEVSQVERLPLNLEAA